MLRAMAITAGPHPEPAIGVRGQLILARVDDDELGTPGFRPVDPQSRGRRGRQGVHAPKEHAASMLLVRCRRHSPGYRHAVGILRAPHPVPGTDMGGGHDVGAAKSVGQALKPVGEVVGGASEKVLCKKFHDGTWRCGDPGDVAGQMAPDSGRSAIEKALVESETCAAFVGPSGLGPLAERG